MKWLLWIIALIVVIGGGWYIWSSMNAPAAQPPTVAAQTYGMTEYTDPTYGFSFWYPSDITITATTTDDSTSFPGGTEVERLDVGTQGSTYIAVVNSPASTITDEPNGHAAPIPQTKYFYDAASGQWMVAYPEGSETGTGGATSTADTSKSTIGGLSMLPSGARFDTTIIPLSTTQFLVIGDGGGSSFTSQLAATVSAAGATIDTTAQSAALEAESTAYSSEQSGQQ